MKRIFVASFLFINAIIVQAFGFQQDLDEAIKKLADKVSISMAEKNKTKIAVIPFQDLSTDAVTTFGKYIAEELTTALFNSGKFNIVERNLLNKVLDELKLGQTGIVELKSAKELGKMTGVDAIIAGTIADLGTTIAINCRLIETESGEVFAAAKAKIIKDESIARLIDTNIMRDLTKSKEKLQNNYDLPILLDAREYKSNFIDDYCYFELISFKIDKITTIKIFLGNPDNHPRKFSFDMPILSDEMGNQYFFQKIEGMLEENPRKDNGTGFIKDEVTGLTKKGKYGKYITTIPGGGIKTITVIYPFIPFNTRKLNFSMNDKSIEINWQELLKKVVNNK
jgi:TolB-like protein